MKLYYAPGACSLTPHILLNELGFAYTLDKVRHSDKTTESGEDFWQINPKGYVPALKLDNGQVLTEGSAISQYLADLKPESNLLPALGQMPRYEVLAWLNFISTELHKNFSPMFQKNTTAEHKQFVRDVLQKRLAYTSQALGDRSCLVGSNLSVADYYLYNILRWSQLVELSLAAWPNLLNFAKGIESRPSVKKALAEEGLSAFAV